MAAEPGFDGRYLPALRRQLVSVPDAKDRGQQAAAGSCYQQKPLRRLTHQTFLQPPHSTSASGRPLFNDSTTTVLLAVAGHARRRHAAEQPVDQRSSPPAAAACACASCSRTSERTREGLARARASDRKLGRPKGSLGVSRLDGKEDQIRHFRKLGVSKARTTRGSTQGRCSCSPSPASPILGTRYCGFLLDARQNTWTLASLRSSACTSIYTSASRASSLSRPVLSPSPSSSRTPALSSWLTSRFVMGVSRGYTRCRPPFRCPPLPPTSISGRS